MNSVQAELSSARLFTESDTVLSNALEACERGWSVIPLKGGNHPSHGKQPILRWQAFQKKHATENQIYNWFKTDTSAYGVVCGSISNLIVIDFDDEEAQAEFIQRFPNLMKSYIVKTGIRGTLHIYFQLGFPVKSCKMRGGDLKAEGSYVVGAGSRIADGTWEVINDAPVKQISKQALNEVLTVFGKASSRTMSFVADVTSDRSPDYFVSLYHLLAKQLASRNQALFHVGCFMRDVGYKMADIIAVLSNAHVVQAPITKHSPETEAQRLKEAQRTLQSVFTRPACPKSTKSAIRGDSCYVPNRLREAILQHRDGTAFLRIYEGLILVGKSAGELMTERDTLELLSAYGIGRSTVRKALKFSLTPFPETHPHAEADLTVAESHTNTCVFVPTTKGDKTSGRPAQQYVIPSLKRLCELFAVESKGADAITLKDIQTVKSYRSALNRELIRRRSGKYSQKWLGDRIGVTPRTIQRYIDLERIQSHQILHETPIDWNNIEFIPTKLQAKRAGFSIQPYFLQDEQGKRYPPNPVIAKKLLKQKHHVSLMRRDCNVYWYDDKPSPTIKVEEVTQKQKRLFKLPEYKIIEPLCLTSTAMPIDVAFTPEAEVLDLVCPPSKAIKTVKRSDRYYKKPLADSGDEWLAQKVYKTTDNLQEVEARQLVDKYGQEAVGQILGRMEYLREQGKLRNPAGFMKVACRVAWKAIHEEEVPVTNYHVSKRRKGRSTYKDPKNDPLFQSQSYLEWRAEFLGEDAWEYPMIEGDIPF